jgi:regulator of sirC expression with transglutaminase-like and TPR domain
MNAANEIRARFAQEIGRADDQINLARAALLIAQEEYPDLAVDAYVHVLDAMADELWGRLGASDDIGSVINQLNCYLFDEWRFRGNVEEYYDPRNSFLNQVMDRRIGIPITLSVVYLEVGWRLRLPLVGIGFPGHFLIRAVMAENDIVIDPFNQGRILTGGDCQQILDRIYSYPLEIRPSFFNVVTKRQILTRMLTNLKGVYLQQGDLMRALAAIERLVLLNPDDPTQIRDRGMVYFRLKHDSKAYHDLNTYLQRCPTARDSPLIRSYLTAVRQRLDSLN